MVSRGKPEAQGAWGSAVQILDALAPARAVLPLSQLGLLGTSAHWCCEGECQGRVPGGEDPPSWSLRRRGSFRSSAGFFPFCMAAAAVIWGVPQCSCSTGALSFPLFFLGQSLWTCPPSYHIQRGVACNWPRNVRTSDSWSIEYSWTS